MAKDLVWIEDEGKFFSTNGLYRINPGVEGEWIGCRYQDGAFRDLGVRCKNPMAMRMFIDLKIRQNKKVLPDENQKKTVRDYLIWTLKDYYYDIITRVEAMKERSDETNAKLKSVKRSYKRLIDGDVTFNGDKDALNDVFVDADVKKGHNGTFWSINNGEINFFPKGKYGFYIARTTEKNEKKVVAEKKATRKPHNRKRKVVGTIVKYIKKTNEFVCSIEGKQYNVSAADYLVEMIDFVKQNKNTSFRGFLKGEAVDIEEYDLED